jgi:8-oxo-dGTP pyrophosphatase MutT (NUDIX family)
MSTVVVVCALIFNEHGEVLMTKRKLNKLRPGMWEMPGGKVEPTDIEGTRGAQGHALARLHAGQPVSRLDMPEAHASHFAALRREMCEELGVDVHIGSLVSVASFRWQQPCTIFLYHCLVYEGTPAPLDADELRYVDMDYALDHLPMCPAQYEFYADVVPHIARHRQRLADLKTVFTSP